MTRKREEWQTGVAIKGRRERMHGSERAKCGMMWEAD